MSEPLIFHVDVNSAFLSWSALNRLQEQPDAPDLRDIPSAVGGDVKTRHGIITARSIPAKKYGIHTADPVVKALEMCPDLVLVPADFETYRKFSHALMDILRRTANAVEQLSIDEALLDMTETVNTGSETANPSHICSGTGGFLMEEERDGHIPGSSGHPGTFLDEGSRVFPLTVADELREEVWHSLGFTVNIGISTNRLLAKMASDFMKPGRIHTLWPEEVPAKMWPMPVGDLYGCGKKGAARLNDFGIRTIGDAAHADPELLQQILGEKGGQYIYNSANGIASSAVTAERGDAKSYSNETTLANDLGYANFNTDAVPVIRHLSAKVARRLQRDHFYAGTIELSVKTDDFHRFSRQTRLPQSTQEEEVIADTAQELAAKLLIGSGDEEGLFAKGRKIRLIGVGGTNLEDDSNRQMDLFGYLAEQEQARKEEEEKRHKREQEQRQRERLEQERQERTKKQTRLDAMLREVNQKYGNGTLRKGG